MVNLRWAILLMTVIFAACTPAGAVPSTPPKPSREALAAKPIDWSKRTAGAVLVPSSVKHLQLVITPAWKDGEQFAWLVSEGTDVVAVYRSTGKELGELVGEVIQRSFASKETVLDKRSFVILGSFKGPPPPPPDPGGLPGPYVESVLDAAFRLNNEALRNEAVGR